MMDVKNRNSGTRQIVTAALLVALTAIGAWIRIPGAWAPITMQTLFTYLAGSLLDPKFAFLCQLAYVLSGLAGLPVFASGGGLGYIFHPTFGFLCALPFAALLIAVLLQRKQRPSGVLRLVIMAQGAVIIFVMGALWLYGYSRWSLKQEFTMAQIFWSGIIPFIPGETIKILLAAFLSTKIHRVIKESRA
jgi:biotin transport system substrate-specific component